MTKTSYSHSKTIFAAILFLTLLTGSCSADQSDNGSNKNPKLSASPNQPTPVPMPATRKQIPISEMKKMSRPEQILFAREDLAQRLELGLDKVSLSGASPVTWRSGAMGCPKSGEQYTQVLVKGLLIMLRAGNTAYRYHGIPTGEPFYCPNNQAEPPYTNSSDL